MRIKTFHISGFPEFRDALNKTGRHIVYSCEWPMYAKAQGLKVRQKMSITSGYFSLMYLHCAEFVNERNVDDVAKV